MLYRTKPAALASRRASGFIERQFSGPEGSPSQDTEQDLIRAELIGANICTASGITVESSTPVLVRRAYRAAIPERTEAGNVCAGEARRLGRVRQRGTDSRGR